MADRKKQEYYRKNRAARLAYQHEYYKRKKAREARLKEVGLLLEPDEWKAKHKAKVEKRRAYHRAYYAKNGDRIRKQRAEKRKLDADARREGRE